MPCVRRALALVMIMGMCFMEGCQGPGEFALEPLTFQDLPGWESDNLDGFASAMRRSCAAESVAHPRNIAGIEVGDWKPFCQALAQNSERVRVTIESMLMPYRVLSRVRGEDGLFTGYYEPIIQASRVQHGPYQHPIYRKPDDLIVEEDLHQEQGRRRVRRYDPSTGQYHSYLTRADIVAGGLLDKNFELAWARDAVDLFFMQIQGSGVLEFEDGRQQRVGYDATNGHPYFAIGKALVDRGHIDPEHISMQAIRAWLAAHPAQIESVLSLNPSYVFFRELEGEGPIGSQGVALTPERSLAVDRRYFAMGAPFWLDTLHPQGGAFRKLMVAQDTGGAIRGVVRGDIFWGTGVQAGEDAGRMKSKGRYYVLLPKPLI